MTAKLEELTVYELKAVLRAKGLKVSGRKAELIARVAAAPPGVLADVPAPSKGGWGNDLGDDAGAQRATIGRKGKGALCSEFDARASRQAVGLRGAIAIKDGPWAGK